jgi:hypothetical protein
MHGDPTHSWLKRLKRVAGPTSLVVYCGKKERFERRFGV